MIKPYPIKQTTGRVYIEQLPKKKSKGNKHYKVGYTLERDVKIALEQEGFTVFRSAGSHSKADLIAIKEWEHLIESIIPCADVTLVQCKRHKNLMTSREIQEFYDFAKRLSCNAVIAWRDKGIHMEEIKK